MHEQIHLQEKLFCSLSECSVFWSASPKTGGSGGRCLPHPRRWQNFEFYSTFSKNLNFRVFTLVYILNLIFFPRETKMSFICIYYIFEYSKIIRCLHSYFDCQSNITTSFLTSSADLVAELVNKKWKNITKMEGGGDFWKLLKFLSNNSKITK